MLGIALSLAGLLWARHRKAKATTAAAAAASAPNLVGQYPVPPALPNSAALPPPPTRIPLVSDDTAPQSVARVASPLLYPPYQTQGFVGPGAPGPSREES